MFCLFGLSGMSQHNSATDQYLINPLPLNPAFTGSKDVLNLGVSARKQWLGIDNSPTNLSICAHNRLPDTKLGYGLLIVNEEIAISKRTGFMSNFAYHLKTGKSNLSFGLSVGFENYRNEWSLIESVTPEDPAFNLQNESHWRPNFSAGLYYYNKNAFLSFSIPFIMSNQYKIGVHETFGRTTDPDEFNYFLMGGYRFGSEERIEIRPSAMIRYIYASPVLFDLNLEAFYKNKFGLGTIYRHKQSVVGLFKLNLTQDLNLGYSFTLYTNNLGSYQNGSHEIALSYTLIKRTKSTSTSVF